MRSAGSRRMTTATSMVRPGAVQARRPARALDVDHVQVDVGGEPTVEPQLLVAEMPPARERGEVEKPEAHRLLDLVDPLAGEEHPGDMRLHELDAIDLVRVDAGSEEPGNEGVGHRQIVHPAVPPGSGASMPTAIALTRDEGIGPAAPPSAGPTS